MTGLNPTGEYCERCETARTVDAGGSGTPWVCGACEADDVVREQCDDWAAEAARLASLPLKARVAQGWQR